MLTNSQTIDEQQAMEKLLGEIGISRERLATLPPTRQSRLLRYFLPENTRQVTAEERAALLGLAKWLEQIQQTTGKVNRSLLLTLLDLFLALEEKEEAAKVFAEAYPEPNTNDILYFQRVVQLCLIQGDNLGAWEAAIDLRRAEPYAFPTFLTLADLLLRMNDRAGAKRCYEAALELKRESTRTLLSLAESALKEEDLTEAREIAAQLEALPKTSWRTLRQVAGLWRELGEETKAQVLEAKALFGRERGLEAALEGKEGRFETWDNLSQGELLDGIQVKPLEGQHPVEVEISSLTQHLLQTVFGHSTFRAGQAEVISSVLAGRDTLAVLPTGGGKSLCYQLPALVLERPVLVISPLISLMKDQFDNMPSTLQEESAIINSALEPGEAARVLRQVAEGTKKWRLIYAAPERLRQYPFVAAMAQAGLGLLVVDEAHCVTMWGNDFRPDYLFIRRVLDDLAATGHSPTLLAVTATATPAIATEIAAQLGRPLATVRGTMLRSNLHYRVINAPKSERESQLVVLCQELEGSGIVYVRSRQNAERLAGLLQRVGISAGYYHAGLSNPARKRTQDEWNTGWMRIVVATVAFGMGIDKPDVRFIIHYNLPDSVENYVQESGRAGRDGLPSQCVLFYAGSEKGSLTRFRQEDEVDLEMLRAIFTAVKKALGRRTQGVVGQESLWLALNPGGTEYGAEKVSETQLRVGLSLLERAGLLTRHYDLPLTAEITLREEHPTGPLAQLVQAIEISPGEWLDFNLSAAAITLNCPLTDLEPMLLDWAKAGAISYQPGQREMLLELAPISKDSGTPERVNKLLEELSNAHLRRVEQIADYAKSLRCRHAFLARHFGERLPSGNCGACDMCEEAAGEVKTVQTPEIAKVANSSATYPLIYYTLTALANLKAGQSIGKKGIRFIVGGHESGPQGEKNNPAWGTLPGKIKRKEWDELVDQLIKEGFIGQQEVEGPYGQNYQALSLSEKGHSWLEKATPPDAPATSDVKAIGPIKSSEGYNQAVLGCLGTLDPGGKSAAKIGRSGLIRLLLGQQSVLGTTASNPYKGSLAGQLKEKEIEALIEQLVSDGYIEQEEAYLTSGRAYQALRLTADGWLIAKASTKES